MYNLKLATGAITLTLGASNLSCGEKAIETKPNVIYILADDMGYGDVSALNKKGKINTPGLDRLVSEGMAFTDAHTSASVSTPTRYGILTGRYNWRSTLKEGVLWGESTALIPVEHATVASMMLNAGYNTAFIGKWHLGWNFARDNNGEIDFTKEVKHTPNDLGFNYAYGHCGSLDMAPYVYVENGYVTDNGCSPAAKIDELEAKGHFPNYIFRGHKADIFEGGHHVPFIVKWPAVVEMGSQCYQTICTTDLMATLADIIHYTLKDNECEDSYSLLPLLRQEKINGTFREATVHHSINGSFAIRKGDWKLAMCPGSGGWSYPKPGTDDEIIKKLPKIQLYNLKEDPGEQNNLQAEKPEIVEELKALLTKYIEEGRSTPGLPQKNDGEKIWSQLWWMN